MFMPESYHKSHKQLKRDTGDIIQKYLKKFQWRYDGTNILMDIGSGAGDVFMDFIYPNIPRPFKKAICSDISKDMLDYAQNYYENPKHVEYKVLDIATKELPKDLKGKIHQITAIHAMHWLKDMGKGTALRNLYELLHPDGGDCFMIVIPTIGTLTALFYIRECIKWSPFLEHIKEFVPVPYDPEKLQRDFRLMLKDAGFTNITMEETTKVQFYESYNDFKETIRPVCFLLKYIPDCRQEEFLDDFMTFMADDFSKQEESKQMNSIYGTKVKFLAVHCKRLPS